MFEFTRLRALHQDMKKTVKQERHSLLNIMKKSLVVYF